MLFFKHVYHKDQNHCGFKYLCQQVINAIVFFFLQYGRRTDEWTDGRMDGTDGQNGRTDGTDGGHGTDGRFSRVHRKGFGAGTFPYGETGVLDFLPGGEDPPGGGHLHPWGRLTS